LVPFKISLSLSPSPSPFLPLSLSSPLPLSLTHHPTENILLRQPHDTTDVLIADFGLSRFDDSVAIMQSTCGTPTYMAPEILESSHGYGREVDMWAIGVIAYVMLCGYPPFQEKMLPRLYMSIMGAKFDFPVFSLSFYFFLSFFFEFFFFEFFVLSILLRILSTIYDILITTNKTHIKNNRKEIG
jgi:serine/threonine protein kinase